MKTNPAVKLITFTAAAFIIFGFAFFSTATTPPAIPAGISVFGYPGAETVDSYRGEGITTLDQITADAPGAVLEHYTETMTARGWTEKFSRPGIAAFQSGESIMVVDALPGPTGTEITVNLGDDI